MISIVRRDHLVLAFRRQLFARLQIAPFLHQAEWILASAGLQLTGRHAYPAITSWINIRRADTSVHRMEVAPRPQGVAKVLADLGAYKSGKSAGGAYWLAGFAAIPGGRVDLIGKEYDLCAPEFDYLSEILLADSPRGLGLPYRTFHNHPKSGRMLLELHNGMKYECRSWERRDALKGKERDAYYFCEAYMLPGITTLTSLSQNLRRRQGWAVFTTTADRPWVMISHEEGHGARSDWHCTCGVAASENPYTFSQKDFDRDHPERGGMMTREQFAVSWLGRLGEFVGRVYNYQRGDRLFDAASHPQLWKPQVVGGAA